MRPGRRARVYLSDGAAQDRPVSRMAEPDQAFSLDLDPVHPPVAGKGSVTAAVVRKHPTAVLCAEYGMMPRHACIGKHDVALGVAASQVRRASRQGPVRSLRPHHQRWDGSPRNGLSGAHAPASPCPGLLEDGPAT